MYNEIVKWLMGWDLILIAFLAVIFLVIPSAVYAYVARKEKKKKRKKPQKWNRQSARDDEKALALLVVMILLFCIFSGIGLYDYLVLREDMIAENYITYTGEFKFYERRSRSAVTEYVEWVNENGDTERIEHNRHVDRFQTNRQKLEPGNYKGTIVYAPRANVLLWWDAEPIGE